MCGMGLCPFRGVPGDSLTTFKISEMLPSQYIFPVGYFPIVLSYSKETIRVEYLHLSGEA